MAFFEKRSSSLEVILIRRLFVAPAHLHEQVEIAYCQQGEMDIMVDGRNMRLKEGDAAVIFPFLVHSYNILNVASSKGILFIVNPSSFPSFANMLTGAVLASPIVSACDMTGVAQFALSTVCNICENNLCQDADLKVIAWINLLLAEMHQQFLLSSRTIASRDVIIKAIVFIQNHFQEQVTLSDVAGEVGISPNHLSYLLSSQLKISFPSFLNATRLNHALPLLKHSDIPITQICYDSGFNSIRTFNRVFQDEFGISPREMRNTSAEVVGQSGVVSAQQFNIYTGYDY